MMGRGCEWSMAAMVVSEMMALISIAAPNSVVLNSIESVEFSICPLDLDLFDEDNGLTAP
jgi:hypothetical protein